VKAVDLAAFMHERATYLTVSGGVGVDLGVPRVHFESLDTSSAVSWCRDWRAEVRMSALDGHREAPEVVVGSVEFLLLRLSEEHPVADVLALFGPRAVAFAELFDGPWLEPGLDESDEFTDGMPITSVLLILEAAIDDLLPQTYLRAWAVAEVAYTMLPGTAGVLAMQALSGGAPTPALMSADRIDEDWPRIGCASIPGHPRFFGRATLYTYLDDARAALDGVAERVVTVPAR
jgi:hypothetical protein